jgi:hypothetical protein
MKKLLILFLIFLFSLIVVKPVQAGLGITPPGINISAICPGETHEQIVTLIRTESEERWDLEISICSRPLIMNRPTKEDYGPMMSSWISPNKEKLTMAPGILRLPVNFKISVPVNIAPGYYDSYICIKTYGPDLRLGGRVEYNVNIDTNRCKKTEANKPNTDGVDSNKADDKIGNNTDKNELPETNETNKSDKAFWIYLKNLLTALKKFIYSLSNRPALQAKILES